MDNDDLDPDVPIPRPIFVGDYQHAHLHTHAPIVHLVYHLGPTAMTPMTLGHFTLTEVATKSWHSFTHAGRVWQEVGKLPKLKIPGGKMGSR